MHIDEFKAFLDKQEKSANFVTRQKVFIFLLFDDEPWALVMKTICSRKKTDPFVMLSYLWEKLNKNPHDVIKSFDAESREIYRSLLVKI